MKLVSVDRALKELQNDTSKLFSTDAVPSKIHFAYLNLEVPVPVL